MGDMFAFLWDFAIHIYCKPSLRGVPNPWRNATNTAFPHDETKFTLQPHEAIFHVFQNKARRHFLIAERGSRPLVSRVTSSDRSPSLRDPGPDSPDDRLLRHRDARDPHPTATFTCGEPRSWTGPRGTRWDLPDTG